MPTSLQISEPGAHTAAWAEIDVGAIARNAMAIRNSMRRGVELMAVAKAGGYGMGAVEFSRSALAGGATRIAVANVEEAAILRQNGITAPILILYPCLPAMLAAGIEHNVTFSVSSLEEIHALASSARQHNLPEKIKIHLCVDTGMGREGLMPEEAVLVAETALAEHNLDLEGIFTHFSSAEETDEDSTREQIRAFNRVLNETTARGIVFKCRHAANSAGAALFPDAQYNMVRCGLALHGVRGWSADRDRLDLRPALSLKARITSIFRRPAGWPVGYNRTHVCRSESLLARIPFGYSEGYRRALSGCCNVIIKGQRVPVVGTISMNCILADITALENSVTGAPSLGSEAILIGGNGANHVSAEEVSKQSGTIPYVFMTHINANVQRQYVGQEDLAMLRQLPPSRPAPSALGLGNRELTQTGSLPSKRSQRRRAVGADAEGANAFLLREYEGPTLFDGLDDLPEDQDATETPQRKQA